MPTRRDVLLTSVAAAIVLGNRSALAKAAQPATAVNFEMPADACDCHTHIHGDPEKFPFFAGRVYTPELASPEEMAALHKAIGIKRVVIVTPSIYGTDNSATLFGMKARGNDARGVAVIDDKTPEADLDAMDNAGIRGIRINLATAGASDPAAAKQRLDAAIARIKARNTWHVQMFVSLPSVSAIKDIAANAPMPLVFDHFGGANAKLGLDQPGTRALPPARRARRRSFSAAVRCEGDPHRAARRCSPHSPHVVSHARRSARCLRSSRRTVRGIGSTRSTRTQRPLTTAGASHPCERRSYRALHGRRSTGSSRRGSRNSAATRAGSTTTDYPPCPSCRESMPFVAQVALEDFVNPAEGVFYVHSCAPCATVGVTYQQT